MNDERLKVTAQGEREIVMTRSFNAPRELVFDAYTKCELLKRWLLGPDGWTLPHCEVDLRVGGKYRYVWRHEERKTEMGMDGVYREVDRPERLVATERFDDPWYPGEAVSTIVLTEKNGRTLLTNIVQYESREARDGVLKSPMEEGVAQSFDRLEELLASTV